MSGLVLGFIEVESLNSQSEKGLKDTSRLESELALVAPQSNGVFYGPPKILSFST